MTRFWRFAPFYESADGAGAGAPAAVADAPPPVESESLADHEASFAPGVERRSEPEPDADSEAAPSERDETGRFKPRHRAASQRADVDDVPVINAHTKRIKEAEARLGADIARQDGESERAFTLRRRAELLERQAAAPAAREPERRAEPRPEPKAPPVGKFPAFAEWATEHPDQDYDDYTDARVAHNYAALRAQERAEESARSEDDAIRQQERDYSAKLPAARQKFPDYDDVMAALPKDAVSIVVERAAKAIGPEVAYYLASHPDELADLTADTLVLPTDSGFKAAVASTKRYLSTLVASQRPAPSSRSAAAPTGSAPAPSRPLAPRPPNPVRTGSIAEPDTPPDADDQSLSAHEKFYGPKRR